MFTPCPPALRWRSGQQFFNAFAEFGAFFQVTHSVGNEGLHVAHFLPAVVAFAGHQHRVDGLLLRQFGNGVGQLDTAPCARLGTFQFGPDIRRQHVAPHRHQIGVQGLRFSGFSINSTIRATWPSATIGSLVWMTEYSERSPGIRFASTWLRPVSLKRAIIAARL